MAKKKKIESEVTAQEQETVLVTADHSPVVVEPPTPVEPVEVKAPVRVRRNVITFTQWAKSKGVRPRHFAGMQAFLTNPDRSLTSEEWDEIFSKY